MSGPLQIAQAPVVRDRKVDLIIVTSTRAVPATTASSDPRHDAAAHAARDPRMPYHLWVNADGHGVVRLRHVDEVVVPDGLFGPGIALRAEVVCVSGWYSAHRAGTIGEGFLRGANASSPEESPSVERHLRQILVGRVRSLGLNRADVLCLSELGSPAFPGDAVEKVVRAFRGDPEPYAPHGAHYVIGPALESLDELRTVLAVCGFTPLVDGVPGTPWSVHDQTALVAFQAARGLTVTGYLDTTTRAALRELFVEKRGRLTPTAAAEPGGYFGAKLDFDFQAATAELARLAAAIPPLPPELAAAYAGATNGASDTPPSTTAAPTTATPPAE